MSEQVVVADQGTPVQASPAEIIAAAQEQAKAMMDVVEQGKLYQVIRGKKFLQVEAWQLLGAFSGLTPIITESKMIEIDGVWGYEARCEIQDRTGQVVAAAEAICMSNEQNWRGKPHYQLRSMAQTRAISKAFRSKLSFIAVLAGYEPTPAEEMDGVEVRPATVQAQATARAEARAEKPEEGSFNEFAAYQKCLETFGNEIVNAVLERTTGGALPEDRQTWVAIWHECKAAHRARQEGGKRDDRQGGIELYPTGTGN